MSNKNNKKIIWFQHFHKAGGSSIINLARFNQEIFYPIHQNANPVGTDGKLIPLWEYSAKQLENFLDHCQSQGITFIATEWGVPDIRALKNDPRVLLITCIRKPLNRFVSNFYYDLYNGYTPAKTLEEYIGSRNRSITMSNYYCRMLSGVNNSPTEITEETFKYCLNILQMFDLCLILENGFNDLKLMKEDWNISISHTNKTKLGVKGFLALIKNSKFKQLFYRLRYPINNPSSEFIELWSQQNIFDLNLYSEIQKNNFRNNNSQLF